MGTSFSGIHSKALEVNLQETAVEVAIPEEQKVLLEITAARFGVQRETEKLLREVNHRFVNWGRTLEDLQYRAMGDFYHYNSHERGPDGLSVLFGFYAWIAEQADDAAVREEAIRYWSYFIEKVVAESGEHLARNMPPLGHAFERLAAILAGALAQAVVASQALRRLVAALVGVDDRAVDPLLARVLALQADVLQHVYSHWLEREDPVAWYRQRFPARAEGLALPGPIADISHERLRESAEALGRCKDYELPERAQAVLALPDHGQIVRGYLDAARAVESDQREGWQNRLERVHWLLKVLAVESLAPVHEPALHEIRRSCVDVLRVADNTQLEHFVRESFATLRRVELPYPKTVLALIRTIGLEILSAEAADWAELLIDEVFQCDFQYPEFDGYTEEWQVRVNPAHVHNIRTYLELTEVDPAVAPRLLSALVIHLQLGGVFIADTDLFQKDISKLLAADIGPVYEQVKHLLRIFPVYFNDIGAEGELRDVSTRVDEIHQRRDLLCHFLRKQCHIESNPLLIRFVEAVARFWLDGDRDGLRAFVPDALWQRLARESENESESERYRAQHEAFAALAARAGGLDELFQLDAATLDALAATIDHVDSDCLEKGRLLVRLRALLAQKYELEHVDVLERLRVFHRLDAWQVDALAEALADDRTEEALGHVLNMLEDLKRIILSREPTQAIESIYHKRHVAVGIPSMYGHYREERFEAMGLTFRVESLGKALFDRLIASQNLDYITKSTLNRVARWLRLLLRALDVDGCASESMMTGVEMLEQSLSAPMVTVDQYINIFQVISRGIKQLIREAYLETYEPTLERLGERMFERGVLVAENGNRREAMLKVSEAFLRRLIAQAFGLQRLDGLVGKILHTLAEERWKLDRETLNLLMSCDVDNSFVQVDSADREEGAIIHLGYKGYMVKRMANNGFPVPPGFIATTEVFRCVRAIYAFDELRREYLERLQQQLARLERVTGRIFGDANNPLLLSVRSGSAISMPGMLDTFLNVGINDRIAEGLAARWDSSWGAWDAYRRFVQSWGMAHGVNRDLFDKLMREAKHEHVVPKKSQLQPGHMRHLAGQYKQLVIEQGVEIPQDPYEQLHRCVELVLRSWGSDKARAYRREMQIAEEWGTAVIVQCMVYGNLNRRSGTGVALTRHPLHGGDNVGLYGDFITQGQGEDVVSGLVETFPISEEQRLTEGSDVKVSLEKDFPAIYAALTAHAHSLVIELGVHHQEIEFTFESDDPSDLFILQSRDMVLAQATSVPAFVPSDNLDRAKVATGIGAGGGALSGRVAHRAGDIEQLRRDYPDDPIILLRPDTVPDDIQLVLGADGLLTAVGGATSHAAVAAQRLGHPCVVGCRVLVVDEEAGRSELAGHAINTGDLLSINGRDGSVYLGRHTVEMVRASGLAAEI